MRLWSVHPKYLDSQGLVALWREALLAKNVLLGLTKGYKNHPQLLRFIKSSSPEDYINKYLETIYIESIKRNYCFNKDKIDNFKEIKNIPVCSGQIDYEIIHLQKKLFIRNPVKYYENIKLLDSVTECNPLFYIINGNIESWERISDK